MRVRYGTFAGDSGWIACESAAVEGEVLRIVFEVIRREVGAKPIRERIIPLHLVRGPIEIEHITTQEATR